MIKWLLFIGLAATSTFLQKGGGKLMTWPTVLLAVVLLLLLCWLPIRRFRRYGVKHLTPLPLIGDMTRVAFRKLHLFDNIDRIYRSFPEERFVGLSQLIRPVVLIRDLELAKKIIVSDFEHFYDHSVIVDKDVDTTFGRSFFGLHGQEWKNLRNIMTSSFTTFKLKQMVPLIEEVGDRIIGRIEKSIRENGTNYHDIEFEDTCYHYIFEIVNSCFFGLKVDSHNPATEKFYNLAMTLSDVNRQQLLYYFGFQRFPKIMQLLRLTMSPRSETDCFKKIMNQIIKERMAQQVWRPDFIETLLQAKEKRKDWVEDDMHAQSLFVFVASMTGISALMCYVVLAMANYPDIQEKLAQEIRKHDIECGGKINYDTVQRITYLDMIISETLRLWGTSFVERICTKDYNLGRPNDSATEDYIIRKGEGVMVLPRSFMLDPKYFPKPELFDPERFSTENRQKIPSFAYNPFGAGPRSCLGNRFVISVLKITTYDILRRVRILPCAETSTRLRFSDDHVMLRNQEGCTVRLELRE